MRSGHGSTNGLTFGGFYGVGNIEWWIDFDWYIVEQRPKDGSYGRTLIHYDFTVRTDKYSPNAGIAARPIDLWVNGGCVASLDFGYQPGVHKDQVLFSGYEWIWNSWDGTFPVVAAVNASFYYWNSNNMTMDYRVNVNGDGAMDLSPAIISGEQDKEKTTSKEVLLKFKTSQPCSVVQYRIENGSWKNANNGDVGQNGAGKIYYTRISGLESNRKYNITLYSKRDYNDRDSYWNGVIYTKPNGEIILEVDKSGTTNNVAAFDIEISGDYSKTSYTIVCDNKQQEGTGRSANHKFADIAAGKVVSATATGTITGVDSYFTISLVPKKVLSQTAFDKPNFKVSVKSQINKIEVLLSDIIAPQGYREEISITSADGGELGAYNKDSRTFTGLTEGKTYIITCTLVKDKIPTSDYDMSRIINVTVVCGQDTIESLQIVSILSGVDAFRIVMSYSKPTTKELNIDLVAIGEGAKVEKTNFATAPKASATGTLTATYQSEKIAANKDYMLQLVSGLLKSSLSRTKTAPLQVEITNFFADMTIKPKYVEFKGVEKKDGDEYLEDVYYSLKYKLSTEAFWIKVAEKSGLPIRVDKLKPSKSYTFEMTADNGFDYTGLPGTPQTPPVQTVTIKLPAETFLYVINETTSQKYKVFLITESRMAEVTKPMFQVIGG